MTDSANQGLSAASFTGDPRVAAAVAKVLQLRNQKQFSDIIDAEKNQYVDLVMEGGGVLGIALAGFTYVLEQTGIRFLGLGGTSAGSINALMLAALGPPASEKTKEMVQILAGIPMHEFIDGDSDARDFCESALAGASIWKLAWKGIQVVDNLTGDLGLNPGQKFEHWLGQELRRLKVHRYADIEAMLKKSPTGLVHRHGRDLTPSEHHGSLALVAADITTETKADFPRMAGLYWESPLDVAPEKFVRASMSIPLFFHPMKVKIPDGRSNAWAELAMFQGTPPSEAMFVDGGIMSNFPIDLFHRKDRVPSAPTFGVKIGVDRKAARVIRSPGSLLGAIFDSARHTLDFDFIKRNPDYRFLVSEIDTGAHNWLNFNLSDAEKVDLFRRGAECASNFLIKFDWDHYKEIRAALVGAHEAGGTAKQPPASDQLIR